MSNIEVQTGESKQIDLYGPGFYQAWGDDPEVMRQAREANEFANSFLVDGKTLADLPHETQKAIFEKARITIILGDDHE